MKQLIMFLCITSVLGAQAVITHLSPSGLTEQCRILPHIEGGQYSEKDEKKEAKFCSIDFYAPTRSALCPKVWSTSPATMIADLAGSKDQEDEEDDDDSKDDKGVVCSSTPKRTYQLLAKFKNTMNQPGTSGTFSPSALMYYHLSRYFETTVKVPVAVYRSIDREEHRRRVTGVALSMQKNRAGANFVGWSWLSKAETDPRSYSPANDLFTPDRNQIYGSIIDFGGTRYDCEINGVRSSKKGATQYNEFQQTPAFRALRSGEMLNKAIDQGLSDARNDPRIRYALGSAVSRTQMALWMKELSEIVLLDYILNQQDRIGNINFKWRELSVSPKGKVRLKKINSDSQGTAATKNNLKKERSQLALTNSMVQRSYINDNDAGVRVNYKNWARETGMLESLHHFNPQTYRKLNALADDLMHKGHLYSYLAANFGLDRAQLDHTVVLTQEAASILRSKCKSGQLHFDLYALTEIVNNRSVEEDVACENPR
jgi:hypothetical protein